MFDCRACAAKSEEIARLSAQVGELQDRLMAMIGQGYQSQLGGFALSTVATPGGDPAPREPEPEENPTDEEWADQQLEHAAHEAERTGHLRPDFPT